jgi:hypothetical protein
MLPLARRDIRVGVHIALDSCLTIKFFAFFAFAFFAFAFFSFVAFAFFTFLAFFAFVFFTFYRGLCGACVAYGNCRTPVWERKLCSPKSRSLVTCESAGVTQHARVH